MIQKVAVIYCLIVSTTCMVLHQTSLPLYLPHQYQEQSPSYNFGYNINSAPPGDFKDRENLQDNHRGDASLGQYSLRQPDNILRAGDYRTDDNADYNAYLTNEKRHGNVGTDRYVENIHEEVRRPSNVGPQANQPWPAPNSQQASPTPVTITQTSVYHQTYSHGHKSWI